MANYARKTLSWHFKFLLKSFKPQINRIDKRLKGFVNETSQMGIYHVQKEAAIDRFRSDQNPSSHAIPHFSSQSRYK